MANYTTCLECGSVQVDKSKVTVTTGHDASTLVEIECNECGHTETVDNYSGSLYERTEGFDSLTGEEVKRLRQ